MTKEELKDEMKNRISMALKDPILQQGFEIICKNLAKLESRNDKLVKMYNEVVERQNSFQQSLYKDLAELEKENAELKERNKELLESCEGATMMYNDLCKAKEIIKKLVDGIRVLDNPKVELTDCDGFLAKAEQFLKEVSE